MKILTTAIITLFASTTFIACKKDQESTVPPPSSGNSIVGRWVGSYVNDASGNAFYYSLNFKANGVIEELKSSGEKIGEGTYTYENSILTAHYTGCHLTQAVTRSSLPITAILENCLVTGVMEKVLLMAEPGK
jgi:hypothetical protein